MTSPKFSEDVHPLTELKTRASALVRHVHRSRRPVLLTRRGRGVAVLIDLEEYERLVQRADFIEAVEKGAKAAADGDLHPHADAEKILNSFGSTDAQ
ncbi:MAG: type II toxin-antitoxin system Phd/YefM family antitoxin [Deltaproteobacteria bacterium]|nr:type II toxin-antitoxin system Phd/YefM family antitoxin [Deltaproteobacteria bacterium]